jgi:hypothetical protein
MRLEIVFSEALRAVTHQQSVLDSIRTRATTLTAAAALVTPLFGTPVLQARDRAGWPTIVALAALTGVLASTFVVSAPWWRWTFRASAAALLQAVDAGHDVDSMRRHLCLDFERWVDSERTEAATDAVVVYCWSRLPAARGGCLVVAARAPVGRDRA